MTREIRFLYLLAAVLIITSTTIPAYAFIENLQVDKKYYVNNDEIRFSGLVGKGTTGLVTIVINDPNNEFTLLKQAFPKADETFELVVSTNTRFLSEGTYNATAFIVNMTNGASIIFDYYFNENSIPSELMLTNNDNESNEMIKTTNQSEDNQIIVSENVEVIKNQVETTVFPDPDKDPQYYIDRYENEPLYREWFDGNFPDQTIYEIVGIELPLSIESISNNFGNGIFEENSVDSIVITESSLLSDNSEMTQMFFALGGLGILFSAVYGIKRRVDSNSDQIEKNKIRIQRRLSNNSNAMEILQSRLANGEISIRTYKKLRKALEEIT